MREVIDSKNHTPKERRKIAKDISTTCEYSGLEICRIFVDALTDANFHTLRKKLVPIINKEAHTKIRLEG